MLALLFEVGLPKGPRLYRLLTGTLALTAATWGLLYIASQLDTDSEGLQFDELGWTFVFILIVRSLHELRRMLILEDFKQVVDQFFESDFAYCAVASAMVGAIIAFGWVFASGDLRPFQMINVGVASAGLALLAITVVRLIWAIWGLLKRRLD